MFGKTLLLTTKSKILFTSYIFNCSKVEDLSKLLESPEFALQSETQTKIKSITIKKEQKIRYEMNSESAYNEYSKLIVELMR